MMAIPEARQLLLIYTGVNVVAMAATCLWSRVDTRTIRGVGLWVKPFKFMASTALFAATTLWLMDISGASPQAARSLDRIALVLVVTCR